MKLARVLIPAAAAALLLTTGCTSAAAPSEDAAGEACLPAGSVSDAVEVTGTTGEDLELTSKDLGSVETRERTVLKDGEGDVPEEGDNVNASLTMFIAASGEVLQQQPATDFTFAKDQLNDWAYDALRCSTPGQQVAVAIPYAEVFGETEAAETGVEGLSDGDSVVAVLDIGEPSESGEAAASECETLEPRDEKYPEVDLGDGTTEPVITIPECMEPPTELEVKVLKEGKGAVVKADQTIMTNYVGVDWNGAERFDGNWSTEGVAFSTAEGALIEGFTQAMVGQKIGSIVQVTVPPELGYDDGMTRTFVLELIGVSEG